MVLQHFEWRGLHRNEGECCKVSNIYIFYKLYMSLRLFDRTHVPAFASTSLNIDEEYPFASALTVTCQDFSNYLHRDKDAVPYVFGIWWASEMRKDAGTIQYSLEGSKSHNHIKGGAFMWGKYAVAVDFAR